MSLTSERGKQKPQNMCFLRSGFELEVHIFERSAGFELNRACSDEVNTFDVFSRNAKEMMVMESWARIRFT
jgi:hypothetical protein